jgi:predicted nucleic acid-binding protein
MTRPLDTNVIVRYLTNDNPDHSPRAYELFRELAAGESTARLTEAVLVEAVQVLSSKQLYNQPRATIRHHLRNIISFKGVILRNKRRYLRALDLYVATPALSFVDALLAVYAQDHQPPTVISFDAGFDRVPGLTRQEPPPVRPPQPS